MRHQFGVSSAHPLATKAGMDILKEGGNAVDAAISVGYALGVVEPYASGIGGGGVMMILKKGWKEPIVYDYRDKAPLYIEKMESKAAVPGFLKGMETLRKQHASLPINKIMKPAIELAENGFPMHSILHENLEKAEHLNKRELPHFFNKEKPLKKGNILYQKELADTLRCISREGEKSFYSGELGSQVTQASPQLTSEDLQNYSVKIGKPVKSYFHNHEVFTPPPPLSGPALSQVLKMVEAFKLEEQTKTDYINSLARIVSFVSEKYKASSGDPDFISIPSHYWLDETHLSKLQEDITGQLKTHPFALQGDINDFNSTTHFSIMDGEGTVIAATHTISDFFGCGTCINGFFLNNQLRNFNDDGITPNCYEPGKRTHSFISPAIVSDNERALVLSLGSSGGNRIPMVLAHFLTQFFKKNRVMEEILNDHRFFYKDGELRLECHPGEESLCALSEKFSNIAILNNSLYFGGLHILIKQNGQLSGGADPRRKGSVRVR
ncbi:gamma-glutamyltransferase family protein [Salibacterium aidingense]|uniref:gamma-glutamyltransferase family protein n=1 Tax=Salibacterium aidingense TaxID=384933 RepID=UPI003BC528F1